MNHIKRWIGYGALLALVLLAAGCPSGSNPPGTGKGKDKHEEKAPHDGILFAEPNHTYHAELVLNKKESEVTVYLLDKRVKNPVVIEAKTITLTVKNGKAEPIDLKATPQDTDKEGASRFVGKHEKFAADLDYDKVEITVEIKGKPYVLTKE